MRNDTQGRSYVGNDTLQEGATDQKELRAALILEKAVASVHGMPPFLRSKAPHFPPSFMLAGLYQPVET